MRVASLDFGSNTFLMLICDVENGVIKKVIEDHCTVVRLFEGLDSGGRIIDLAMERSKQCLAAYEKIWKFQNVDCVVAVATSAVRDASNGDEFLDLARFHGICVNVISGQEEANLSFRGGLFGLPLDSKSAALIDIGGGSTEFVYKNQHQSLDIGSVRLTEKFSLENVQTEKEISNFKIFLQKQLCSLRFTFQEAKFLVAVAGTPTTLAVLEKQQGYSFDRVHEFVLSQDCVGGWIQKLSRKNAKQRSQIPFMPQGRGDVLLAGASILFQVMEKFAFSTCIVSCGGVRFGLALSCESRKGL